MVIYLPAGIRILLDFISENDILALDTETTGLNVRSDSIIGFSVSNGEKGIYVVHQYWDVHEKCLKTAVPLEDCKIALAALAGKRLITWNGAFDLPFIKNYFGVDLLSSLWSEGMLAKHTVDEERPFALKEVGAKIFGESAKAEQIEMLTSILRNGGTEKEFYKADVAALAKYAIKDTLLTYRLNEHYLNQIRTEGLEKFYFEDEVMPLYREVTIPMEQNGIRLDMDLLIRTRTEITADIAALEAKIRESIQPHLVAFEEWFLSKEYPPSRTGEFAQQVARYYKMDELLPKTKQGNISLAAKAVEKLPDNEFKRFLAGTERLPSEVVKEVQKALQGRDAAFNLQSKHHWKKVFFDHLRETPLSYTETGMPQCDDEFLESIATKYEFIPWLLDYNRLNKIKSTYVDRFIEESENGFFYPRFQQHSTISGRYSGDLQQLNRPKQPGEASDLVVKYNNRIRAFFIAKDSKSFIDCDYNSLEPHVFAHVSGDQNLKNIFLNNLDFYSLICIRTEGLTQYSADKNAANYLGALDKNKRQAAKVYSLGIPYGKGPFSLSKDLNISESEAKRLWHGYLNGFPDLAKWMESSKQQCLSQGWVQSEAGRRRHMKEAVSLYAGWGEVLLDPLKVYEKWGKNPEKYKSMKFLSQKLRNYVNNSRNFQIQSLAASITNRASIAINRRLKTENIDGTIIAQIHDQILVEVPEEKALQASKIVQECMENAYKLSIPLKAPPAICKNFLEGH